MREAAKILSVCKHIPAGIECLIAGAPQRVSAAARIAQNRIASTREDPAYRTLKICFQRNKFDLEPCLAMGDFA